MRKILQGSISLLLIVLSLPSFAERAKIKYGDIKPEDFAPAAYKVDSSASGIVLFDVASSVYEGDNQGGFSIIFKRHTRIHLINRNSFDLATISIPIYASGLMEEKIESLEATTYTLENGKVESFKLDKASVYKDKLSKNYTVRKFTLPNLKEGCIIEIKYNLKSPYERDLRSWHFQGQYPRLWSEYTITVPSIYNFTIINQGYHPFVVKNSKQENETYNILVPGKTASERNETFRFNTTTVTSTWAMENVPALKEENFTTTLDNHIAKIDFQLAKISYPNSAPKNVLTDWYTAAADLLKDENFGEGFSKNTGWYKDELKKITAGTETQLESAKKIYEYVRDNYTCTRHSGIYLTNPLKKTYQAKSGNVADINLLLTSLLMHNGLDAHPVLLSTRENGKAIEAYPVMDKLNYVITKVKIKDSTYLLDASEDKLGFGKLSHHCYNGYARIIDKDPVLIDLDPENLKENKQTFIFLTSIEGGGMTGTFKTTLGDYESHKLREKLVKTSKDDYFKEVKKQYSTDVDLTNIQVDSLKAYEKPITVKYDLKFDLKDDIIYLNPVFGEGYKENPFKAAERRYPVEMPYTINENFNMTMRIPDGFTVEEIPKSARVKFNDDEGNFEYLISKEDMYIQMRWKLQIKKAFFIPEDYQSLRDFFGFVVKKHSEQIVLKKIK